MKTTSTAHAVNNHAGKRTYITLGIVGNHLVHVVHASIDITLIKFAQSTNKNKLVTVCAQWETRCRQFSVARHLTEAVGLERFVCRRIYRVFDMHAVTRILFKIWI